MNVPKALLDICDDMRIDSAVNYVYADIDQCCVFATNRKMIIRYPIGPDLEHGEVSGYIPAEAVKAAATVKGISKGYLLHLDKDTIVPGKGTFPNPFSMDATCPPYPDWNSVYHPLPPDCPHFTFNASFLIALAKVLSPTTQVVYIHYDPDKPGEPLQITGIENGTGIGLLMPYIVKP